jgi:hypothetical protein
MSITNLYYDLNLHEWLESLIPDFLLAFAFFTSIVYAVLGKRFDRQRPAIAMSASMGFALSIGLVWWEQANNLSIKNLGPIAIGFAILILGFVMNACIKQIGGSWAGAGIAIGASIIVAQLIGLNIPIDTQILQTITVVALIIGVMAFLSHIHPKGGFSIPQRSVDIPKPRKSLTDLFRDRHLSDNLTKTTRKLRKQSASLNEHPENAGNVMVQLKRMLPAQGYLTERMAQLRAKAHQIRNGHIARLEETKEAFKNLPTPEKKKAAEKMAAMYNQMIGVDKRLERLDHSVAETEKRIKDLNLQAQRHTQNNNFQKLTECLKKAEHLQKHNTHLFKLIEQTEEKLIDIAKTIAKEAKK